jgi:hypothetical protein
LCPDLKRSVAIAALLSIGTFAVYAALAARDVMFGDALELVASAARNGVAHPPGYPLWIVLAHLATLVPFGQLAYRANLTASGFHALTVGLVYAGGYVLVRRHGPALFAALLLAVVSPLFVTWSLQAEVFSLNDLFAAAIVLLCLLWLEDASRWRLVVPIAALFGLGLANQQTLILLAPLPLWVAWCGRNALRSSKNAPQALGLAALALLFGFCLPYLHTILASQRLGEWELGEARTLPQLIDVIDRRAFGTFNLVSNPGSRGGSAVERAAMLVLLGGWPYLAVAAGLIGLALRKRYAEVTFAALIVAGPLLAFCAAANLNLDTEVSRGLFSRFGLLPLVALAPFSACAAFLLDSFARDRLLRTAVIVAAVFAAFVPAALHLPALSLSGAHDARTLSRDVFAALPPHAILLTTIAAAPPYFQTIEDWRPDVTIVRYGYLSLAEYRNDLRRTIAVPPQVASLAIPLERRDLLVHANPARPLFVVGDRWIHAPSRLYKPLVEGVVSEMIPARVSVDIRRQYARETALQSRPGYGQVSAAFWKSNGFGELIRGFYASGFFFTGLDAKDLGDLKDARAWLERAREYAPDPLIDQELQQLNSR